MEFTILFIAHHYYDFLMFLFFKSFQDKLTVLTNMLQVHVNEGMIL